MNRLEEDLLEDDNVSYGGQNTASQNLVHSNSIDSASSVKFPFSRLLEKIIDTVETAHNGSVRTEHFRPL